MRLIGHHLDSFLNLPYLKARINLRGGPNIQLQVGLLEGFIALRLDMDGIIARRQVRYGKGAIVAACRRAVYTG